MISSANRLILWMETQNVKLVMARWERIFSASGSIVKLKIVGDSGHSCQVLLEIANDLDSGPDALTFAEGVEYKARIADKIVP